MITDVWEYRAEPGCRGYLRGILYNNRPAAFKGAPGYIRAHIHEKAGKPDVFEVLDEWGSEEDKGSFYETGIYEEKFARFFLSFWARQEHKDIRERQGSFRFFSEK
jgi:quinol monooxygenase YgiN